MADTTKITWTHRPGTKGCTWNPIIAQRLEPFTPGETDGVIVTRTGWYCEHESEACRYCYSEAQNLKGGDSGGTGLPYKPGILHGGKVRVFLDKKRILQPLHWRAPRTIFVCSMTDIFGRWVEDEWLDRIFAVAALCPQHVFIILTKRAARMLDYVVEIRDDWERHMPKAYVEVGLGSIPGLAKTLSVKWPLQNVWLGVTAEDQTNADKRIPLLLSTPAAVRFISIEPMLGPVDIRAIRDPRNFPGCLRLDALLGREHHEDDGDLWTPGRRLDWVICGGETGTNARPMHPDWARSLRDQCGAAGVPFFFKQWGEYLPVAQTLPGCGKVHGATAVKPGRMKLHYGGTRDQEPKHAFVERGVEFAAMVDGCLTFRVGKRRAGRMLDGRKYNEWPERRP